MNRLSIIGGGSWGTALAIALAPRFEQVRMWVREPEVARELSTTRENRAYLPGFRLPDNLTATSELAEAGEGASILLGVMPSRYLRELCAALRPHAPRGVPFVSATKGLETGTLLRMSEVVGQALPDSPVAVLSGPNFAKEVAAGLPTVSVIASRNLQLASKIQSAFSTPHFRFYTNADVVGVEIGGALKNVIAIGAGMCAGLELGHNAVAALITRGLSEISRLAVALGADPLTLAGLAGLGDLVLTCTGDLSRNRKLGMELARGRTLAEVLASTKTVAEGVDSTYAAHELARKVSVDLPITDQMYNILREGKPVAEAVRDLMARDLKGE
jgi:glycerol-3-phosphate dehydrogenase (NAD(P)+)